MRTKMPQAVIIYPTDPPGHGIHCYRGPDISVPQGEGGWAVVSRPQRVGMTEWQGYEPWTMTLSLLFDRLIHRGGGVVTRDVYRLRSWMRNQVGPRSEPIVVRVKGDGIPLKQLRWVLANMDVTAEDRSSHGDILRTFVTVTLREYVPGDVLLSNEETAAARARSRNGQGASHTAGRSYTVRHGDTLSSIAARQLGYATRWHEIADLNRIRDPKSIRVGQVLRLP